MSAATASLYVLTLNFSPQSRPSLKSPKHVSSTNSFALRQSASVKSPPSRRESMTELSKVFAFRSNRCGDGGFAERGNILGNGSSEFRTDVAPSGWEYVLNKSSKWLVAATFGAVILWKHDAEVLWIAMGSVLNAWLSVTLKQLIKQQRPVPALKSDPGMPSSHAQSIFFCAVFVILALFQWLEVNALTMTIGGLVLISGSYLSWLRVSQQLHTTAQVLVGAIVGSILSISWFWLWHGIVLKAFISYLWVRIVVVLGAVGFCLGFVIYVIQNWLLDEN